MAAFQQRARLSIRAFCGVDYVLQHPVATQMQNISQNGGQVNLLGQIEHGVETSEEQLMDLAEAKIAFCPSRRPAQGHLTVLVDALQARERMHYDRRLTSWLPHLEYDMVQAGTYRPSRWLNLVNHPPVQITLQDSPIKIPSPLRQYPLSPRALGQSDSPADVRLRDPSYLSIGRETVVATLHQSNCRACSYRHSCKIEVQAEQSTAAQASSTQSTPPRLRPPRHRRRHWVHRQRDDH